MKNALNIKPKWGRKSGRAPALVHVLLTFRPGESIHSRAPKHKLDDYLEDLEGLGYVFSLSPTSTGYRILCESAPEGAPNA